MRSRATVSPDYKFTVVHRDRGNYSPKPTDVARASEDTVFISDMWFFTFILEKQYYWIVSRLVPTESETKFPRTFALSGRTCNDHLFPKSARAGYFREGAWIFFYATVYYFVIGQRGEIGDEADKKGKVEFSERMYVLIRMGGFYFVLLERILSDPDEPRRSWTWCRNFCRQDLALSLRNLILYVSYGLVRAELVR